MNPSPTRRRPTLVVLAWLLGFLPVLLVAVAPPAAALELPKGLCGGLLEVALSDLGLCTHGPDRHLAAAPTPAQGTGSLPSMPTQCVADGNEGERVAVLAVDVDGRTGAADVDVRRWVGQVEWTVRASAERDGGERYVRWVTERGTNGCQVAVTRVSLRSSQVATFEAMIEALVDLGYDRADRKYLAFVDADVDICGIATVSTDTARTNNQADRSTGYARVDRDCWAAGDDGVYSVAAHELFHTLGAVSPEAPHGTDGYHCTDEWDLLCYDDGSGATTIACEDDDPNTTGPNDHNHALLDCNGDDYFNAGTPSGWLARNWNTADSAHLSPYEGAGAGHPTGGQTSTLSSTDGRTVRLSPALGQHGPVVAGGYGFEACDVPLDVVVADGQPVTRSSGGLFGLGGSSETEASASALRDAVNNAASWVNGAVGRNVLRVDPDGVDPNQAVAQPATITVVSEARTASTGTRVVPTRVELKQDGTRLTSAILRVDEGASAGRLDTWVAQGIAQSLGLGRSGTGSDLMAPWPVAQPSRDLAGDLLSFLYEAGSCSEDRRIRDTASGHSSQRATNGERARLDLAVGTSRPIDVAVATSRWLRQENTNRWADVVIICRDDVHADCLAGSSLAGTTGPILFVPGGRDGRLPDAVRDEVVASINPGSRTEDAGTVYVLGGPGAVSVEVERALAAAVPSGVDVQRVSGPTRHGTAAAIAEELMDRRAAGLVATEPGAPAAILARSDDPVDAVAAGAYAAAHGVPVLLTTPGALPTETRDWLARNGGEVVGIGGRAAIADATLAQAGRASGDRALRVSGPDRFQTALAVATDADLWGQRAIDEASAWVVVNGRDARTWAYALAVAPVAAQLDAPVVFVERSGLPGAVRDHLVRLPVVGASPAVTTVTIGQGDFLSGATVEAFHGAVAPGFDGNVQVG